MLSDIAGLKTTVLEHLRSYVLSKERVKLTNAEKIKRTKYPIRGRLWYNDGVYNNIVVKKLAFFNKLCVYCLGVEKS